MLSIPKAKDLCIGSTALKVATVPGMAAIKVNHVDMNIKTKKPGMNEHETPHFPLVPTFLSFG